MWVENTDVDHFQHVYNAFFFFLFYAEQTKGKGGGILLHDLRDDE